MPEFFWPRVGAAVPSMSTYSTGAGTARRVRKEAPLEKPVFQCGEEQLARGLAVCVSPRRGRKCQWRRTHTTDRNALDRVMGATPPPRDPWTIAPPPWSAWQTELSYQLAGRRRPRGAGGRLRALWIALGGGGRGTEDARAHERVLRERPYPSRFARAYGTQGISVFARCDQVLVAVLQVHPAPRIGPEVPRQAQRRVRRDYRPVTPPTDPAGRSGGGIPGRHGAGEGRLRVARTGSCRRATRSP